MTLAELKQARAAAVAEMRALHAAAQTENRSLTAEESAKFDAAETRAKGLGADIERQERLDHYDALTSNQGRRSDPLPHEAETRHQYSLAKALVQSIEARTSGGKLDGLEKEVHDELAKRRYAAGLSNREVKGVLIPLNLPVTATRSMAQFGSQRVEQRAFDTTAGAGVIPTIVGSTMIDLLRNRTVCVAAGATMLTGMQGLFAIPRQSGAATGYWVGEGGAPTASAAATDQVSFSPKTAGGYTDYTRRTLHEAMQSLDLEMFLRDDLTNVVARTVDLGALNGSGSSNQPTGIMQNSSITTKALGTNGAALAWADIVSFETSVSTANADMGALKYVTNSKVRGKLKTTVKDSNTAAVYLWGSDNSLNSYPALVSNQMPSNLTKGSASGVCSSMIFGNWNDLIIAMWSGIDVTVDPFSLSTSGGVRLVVLQDVDINVRHVESFVKCVDILTT